MISFFLLFHHNLQGPDNYAQPLVTLANQTLKTASGDEVSLSFPTEKPLVFIFLSTTCPIGNRLAPAMSRVSESFKDRADFYFVYPDKTAKSEEIRNHATEYKLSGTPIHDPIQSLAHSLKATITPECAVVSTSGLLLYRGRVNDQYVDHTRFKLKPTKNDLEEALTDLLKGDLKSPRYSPAIGCTIE